MSWVEVRSCSFTSPGFLLPPSCGSKEVGWRPCFALRLGATGSDWGYLLALIWWQFRVARGWFRVIVGLAEVLNNEGGVLGLFFGQGLIFRMPLGGFKVEFESVGLAWVCFARGVRPWLLGML